MLFGTPRPTVGVYDIAKTGRMVRVSADGNPRYKAGGVTIDWDTVPVVDANADTTWTDDNIIPAGAKALRYGTVLCKITATGLFGPYDSGAEDGRAALVRGECFLLNETVLATDFKATAAPGGVFDGGLCYLARVLNNGTDMTTNPARADIETAFPVVTWVED